MATGEKPVSKKVRVPYDEWKGLSKDQIVENRLKGKARFNSSVRRHPAVASVRCDEGPASRSWTATRPPWMAGRPTQGGRFLGTRPHMTPDRNHRTCSPVVPSFATQKLSAFDGTMRRCYSRRHETATGAVL